MCSSSSEPHQVRWSHPVPSVMGLHHQMGGGRIRGDGVGGGGPRGARRIVLFFSVKTHIVPDATHTMCTTPVLTTNSTANSGTKNTARARFPS